MIIIYHYKRVALYHHSEESAHVTEHSPGPSVIRSVSVSVGRSVSKVYCGKMADWIQMPCGVVSGVSRGMDVLDGGGYRQRGRGSFGVKLGIPL